MELSFNELPNAVAQVFEKLNNIERLLLERNTILLPAPEELLSIKQTSEILNLSVPTLYGYVHRSQIPVCKRGKRLYFLKHELLQWVKDGRKKSLIETGREADNYLKRERR
ncbi:MAG TPA: helix-turn-helix domain-containing protein [Chitinophagaceae bacterium]|nr:helix-turn-helix domain-containing protein [Chitinophagaceae bacterium]